MTLLENKTAKRRRVFIMIVYLAGIFMGALDTGIVTPARTLIQNGFGVGSQTGIWMITIYTLAYAASIPIMGKIADKFGRKYIYLISIFLFGFGSLFCGLSQYMGSFSLLLISRVIQAIGGGGIVPIATAEFGTTFPKEKRGIALGLVGGTYGIANIFGASAGSAILDIFGSTNWSYIFFINVPITILILIFGIILLPNSKIEIVKKIDFLGIFVLTSIILSLLYGLKNINYMSFVESITSTKVYLFILIALILIPIFILIEKNAEDPVLNISYFKNKRIVITLLLSFISGVILMGTIFVPQFSENAMKIASGSGGYFVILLGVFAGIGAPLSGKLIDKFGVKPVLSFGFATTISAALFLIFVTINYPSIFTVAIALMLIGLGMGFSLGTPLNYMMLENTKVTESNSALATLSLVRSIGTTIAPSIMIAFIASAGILVQSNVMATLPTEVVVPPLVYSQDISDAFTTLQDDPRFAAQFENISFPDLTEPQVVEISMSSTSDSALPQDLIDLLKSADVTTITDDSKTLAIYMFNQFTPSVVSGIQDNVQTGIDAIEPNITTLNQVVAGVDQSVNVLTEMQNYLETLPESDFGTKDLTELITTEIYNQIPGSLLTTLSGIKTLAELNDILVVKLEQKTSLDTAIAEMEDLVFKMNALKDDVPVAFESAKTDYLSQIEDLRVQIEDVFQSTLNGGFRNIYLTTMSAAILGLGIISLYKPVKHSKSEEKS